MPCASAAACRAVYWKVEEEDSESDGVKSYKVFGSEDEVLGMVDSEGCRGFVHVVSPVWLL